MQHLYKYLLFTAATYKTVLQLKDDRNAACWSLATDDSSRARGWEEGKGIWGRMECSSTRDLKHKGFQEKAENFFRHLKELRRNGQGTSLLYCLQSFIVGGSL